MYVVCISYTIDINSVHTCIHIHIYKNTAILVQCDFCAIKVNREETELAPFWCIRDTVGRLLEMHVKKGGSR